MSIQPDNYSKHERLTVELAQEMVDSNLVYPTIEDDGQHSNTAFATWWIVWGELSNRDADLADWEIRGTVTYPEPDAEQYEVTEVEWVGGTREEPVA